MKILFTGASSFTGYHIINELARNNDNEIHITLSRGINDYVDIKKKRISQLDPKIIVHQNVQFGDNSFLNLLQSEDLKFELLCCHGAYVENYNSDDFDIQKAVNMNTRNISSVIKYFKQKGGKFIINTGSIFEPYEGQCEGDTKPFNLYGLSKYFTNELFKYYCSINKVSFGKFVIPNPFGILEEPRFTNYLFSCWKKNEIPEVKTPKYIRDNIPVELLARSYVDFINKIFEKYLLGEISQEHKLNPSGYVESQGDFTNRIINQVKLNFNYKYSANFFNQTEFAQPVARYNSVSLFEIYPEWDESKFWVEYLNSYIN